MTSVKNALETVRQQLRASAEVKNRVADECAGDIVQAAGAIAESIERGGKILLCGNGGSAADCQHMATEFVSRLTVDYPRPAIPAIALTTDTSFLTAFTNDINFEDIFARQVEALGNAGDVLVGISTSGGSKNVVRAADVARAKGMTVIALLGKAGVLADRAHVSLRVPSESTQYIQESHLAIEHAICYLVERMLYPRT